MYKSFVTSLGFLSIVAFAGGCASSKQGNSKRLPGVWQVSPIEIDGNNKDWPAPYPNYDDKAMLGYAVSNDKENIYITVETGDPATQLKMLKGGLTVWLDRTGGKNENTAINYPLPESVNNKGKAPAKDDESASAIHLEPSQGQKRLLVLRERVEQKMEEAKEFSLQGFKACNEQFSILEKDSCGIKVRIALDQDNELVWEAVIPFRSFYSKAEISRVDKGRPLSICIETEGSKRPEGAAGGGGKGAPRGGGFRPSVGFGGFGMQMGGMRGGGNNTRNASQPDHSMESLYKSSKTWKTFGIAWKE